MTCCGAWSHPHKHDGFCSVCKVSVWGDSYLIFTTQLKSENLTRFAVVLWKWLGLFIQLLHSIVYLSKRFLHHASWSSFPTMTFKATIMQQRVYIASSCKWRRSLASFSVSFPNTTEHFFASRIFEKQSSYILPNWCWDNLTVILILNTEEA